MGTHRKTSQSPNMSHARVSIAVTGVLIPYLARVPGTLSHGSSWFTSYLDGGVGGFLLLGAFNAIAWGSLVALSYFLRKPSPLIVPSVAAFAFLAFAHSQLDLASDAQAAVALVFIPIYALPVVLLGFMVSVGVLGRGLPRLLEPPPGASTVPAHRVPKDGLIPPAPFECPSCGAMVSYGASHCRDCEHCFRYSTPLGERG